MLILGFPKSMLSKKFRHFSFHKLTRRSLEILNLYTVLKNHEREARKMHFVPQGEFSRMRTTNLNLMMQISSPVVQIIIAHKFSYYLHIQKMRLKIKLRWQWNSVYMSLKSLYLSPTIKGTWMSNQRQLIEHIQ